MDFAKMGYDAMLSKWRGAMKRRTLIKLMGGAAVAWPLGALAQQQADKPALGFRGSRTAEQDAPLLAAFHQGLKEGGFVDGQNVTIEYRWGDSKDERLPGMARELVAKQVAVIAAMGSAAPSLAAKAETSTIPVV